jgi:LPXTG-site transpeptidase (sortase) family protein
MTGLRLWLIGTGVAVMLAASIYRPILLPAPTGVAAPMATIPAVAPAGIPPVVGDGILAIVPAHADSVVIPVTADFGGGWRGTLLVPADPSTPLAVRVQVLDGASLHRPNSSPDADATLALSVQVYDAATGHRIDPFPSPMAFALRPPTSADFSSLAAFGLDGGGARGQPLTAVADQSTGTKTVTLYSAGQFALGPQSPVAGDAPLSTTASSSLPIRSEAPDRAALPVRLRIASIGVDAPIVPVGLEPDGSMAATEEAHVIGWYEPGPRPGEVSNAILTGHVDWQQQTAVFFRLREVKPGDTVEVISGFKTLYRYQIESVRPYRTDEAPVAEIFAPTSAPFLTLITCDGPFDHARREYLDRLVVRAHGI